MFEIQRIWAPDFCFNCPKLQTFYCFLHSLAMWLNLYYSFVRLQPQYIWVVTTLQRIAYKRDLSVFYYFEGAEMNRLQIGVCSWTSNKIFYFFRQCRSWLMRNFKEFRTCVLLHSIRRLLWLAMILSNFQVQKISWKPYYRCVTCFKLLSLSVYLFAF